MSLIKSLYLSLYIVCMVLAGAGSQVFASTDWRSEVILKLQTQMDTSANALAQGQRMALLDYYQSPTAILLWSDQNGRLARAAELRQMLQQSMTHGLDPSPYRLQEIETYWDKNDVTSAVALEMLLSQALLTYANELYSGRYAPHDVDKEWHMKPRVLDNSKLFLDVSGQPSITEILGALAPSHDIYKALQKRLAEYMQLAKQGGWPVIPEGPTLRPDMQHKQIPQIRQRLSVTGDLKDVGPMDSPVYDDTLVEAVKNYQTRNGLSADGVIGKGTRAAMNIPVEQRVIQMRINLERWRWLPLEFKGHSLVVNMTGYMLYSFQDHDIVLEMPVIVGKKYRSTPSFNNVMSYIELNPYWNVPTSIAVKDLIPAQKRNPGYLKKKHIRVYRGWKKDAKELDPATVDWSKVSEKNFPYRLRQDPGPHNSLGTMKFMLPNKYAIYLHDTPHRELFKRHDRAFSSGCIRVQDPLYLATYVMGDTSEKGRARIEKLLATGKNQALRLPKKIPVYLVYMTSWVDRKGNLNFRKDIYGRDKRMLAAVCKNRPKKCEKAQISY